MTQQDSPTPAFRVGDWAEWDTGRGTIRGECLIVVPSGRDFRYATFAIDICAFANGDGAYAGRNHESYIFASKPGPRGGKRKLYWPKVSKLRPSRGIEFEE